MWVKSPLRYLLPFAIQSCYKKFSFFSDHPVPGHTQPVLALSIIHGPVRLCPVLSDPHRPCMALPCSTMPYTVLSDLVQPCLMLSCSTLPDAARPGPVRPRATLPISALHCPGWRCLAWPCLALSCPSLSNPAGPCPARPDLPGTVRHCLALSNPV